MIPEQRLREIADEASNHPQRPWVRALAAELLAARADAESARREGQEIAAGLHEKLHELRAENERLVKQRDAFQSEMARAFGMASTLMEAVRDFDYYANHVDDALRAEAWARVKAVVDGLKERGA